MFQRVFQLFVLTAKTQMKTASMSCNSFVEINGKVIYKG